MQKIKQTPGTVLKGLLKKHGLNCNRLAKAINMSNAMVRLLVLDKSPISLSAAFRLAKFFKTKPEYWLGLQQKYDLAKAASSKSLARELSGITDVTKYTFVRKPHATKKGKKKTTKRKTTAKRKAPAKRKTVRKTARKTTRKPARKVARKPGRKTTRKPGRKTRRK